jgi:UMF1 family MFS transporter
VVSLSVVLQVLVMPVVGAFADVARSRRAVMGLFAYVGALAVMGMFFLQGPATSSAASSSSSPTSPSAPR